MTQQQLQRTIVQREKSCKIKQDAGLMNILNYRRPAGSYSEEQCIKRFLDPVEGMQIDTWGNRYIKIGDNPKTMFSCHTDTVHKTEGMQKVFYDENYKQLFTDSGECLGADDGAGMIILLEMIKEKVPGLYIFHREEEVGGLGSNYIATSTPELLDGYKRCVAFDRKGSTSVITHQLDRCCSDKFATELAHRLGYEWTLDDTGLFTDTANYIDIIPECTNLSCGYDFAHSPAEILDLRFLRKFIKKLCIINWEDLGTYRDPLEEAQSYSSSYNKNTWNYNKYIPEEYTFSNKTELNAIYDFVTREPWRAAKFIKDIL